MQLPSDFVGLWLELQVMLHFAQIELQLLLLAPEAVLGADSGTLEHNHGLVAITSMLIVGQQVVDGKTRQLVQMVQQNVDLLLLVVALPGLSDAVLGDLPIVVVQVRGLADVALVVLAHAQLLYATLLVVLLIVEKRSQQTFLCVFLCSLVVLS